MVDQKIYVDLRRGGEEDGEIQDFQKIDVDLKTSVEAIQLNLELEHPNILLITVDDCGVDNFGAITQYESWINDWYGIPLTVNWPDMRTVQAIADEGVVFTEARAYPVCSPSRATWHTGRYGFRTGVGTAISEAQTVPTWTELGTAPADLQYILPRVLSDWGYRTCVFGKWHLAVPDGISNTLGGVEHRTGWGDEDYHKGSGWSHPTDIGWQHARLTFQNLDKPPIPPKQGSYQPGYYNFWYRDSFEGGSMENQTSIVSGVHHTIKMKQGIKNFITQQTGGDPWFICWNLSAIHAPWGNPLDNSHGWSGLYPPNASNSIWTVDGYLRGDDLSGDGMVWDGTRAALENFDHMLSDLKDDMGAAMWARTVVIIVGDNGTDDYILKDAINDGETFGNYATEVVNASPSRMKHTVFDPGIRVPLIVGGPVVGGTGGRVCMDLVDTTDLYKTIRDIAGVPDTAASAYPGYIFDSHSFGPCLRSDDGSSERDYSFSEYFSKNGDPSDAGLKKRAYTRWVTGADEWQGVPFSDPDDQGLWKFIKTRGAAGDPFDYYLYRLADDPTDPDSPDDATEQINLTSVNVSVGQFLADKLNSLLTSEQDEGP